VSNSLIIRNIIKCSLVCLLWACFDLSGYSQMKLKENKGQWHPEVKFKADIPGGFLFVSNQELTYLFYDHDFVRELHHTKVDTGAVKCHSVKIKFLGSSVPTSIERYEKSSEYYNYFIGNDKSRWASGVQAYSRIILKNLYPNIDLELYEKDGFLKYNLILNEGADYRLIKMKYEGADKLYLKNGNLHIKTSLFDLKELAPFVFQGDEKNELKSKYKLKDNVLSFSLLTEYSGKSPVIIDPFVVFSTYSGSVADNFGYTATFDKYGNGYSGGSVFDIGFPATAGAFQTYQGAWELTDPRYRIDVGILKYNPTGTGLIYATYLGGARNNDHPHSMIVDKNDRLIVFGTTESSDFPIATGNVIDPTHNGLSDIYLAKLSKDGKTLLRSTFIGGGNYDGQNGVSHSTVTTHNYADEYRGEVILDDNNCVYVSSCTNSPNFPMKNSFNPNWQGKQEAVVFKLSENFDTLLWSSFFGGPGDDAAYGISLGVNNELFFTGGTASNTVMPLMKGHRTSYNGGQADGWLVKMNSSTGAYVAGTFIGTDRYDQCYFVKTDKFGFPFVYGQTQGLMPVTSGAYNNPRSGQFIQKYSRDLTNLEIGMVFGSGGALGDISPTAFLVDECERVFVSGWGGNVNNTGNGDTRGLPITQDAYQKTTDGSDFYVAIFSKNIEELLYSTYFGGNSEEHVDGGTSRFDEKGIIYQSVCASCDMEDGFPTTPGAWSTTNKGRRPTREWLPGCNNALFKIDFENLNRKPVLKDTFLTVVATHTLTFDILGIDPDKYDTLEMVLSGDIFGGGSLLAPFATVTTQRSVSPLTNTLNWTTTCDHLTGDTLEISVKLKDHGCPDMDSTFATIKVLVLPPPLPEVPENLCVNFNGQNSINVWWDQFQTNSYFKKIELYKVSPNDDTTLLATYWDGNAVNLKDDDVNDPKNNNYCYFFKAYNICDMEVVSTFGACTKVELNSPISGTEIITATVINDESVKIIWKKSDEPDFFSYEVYRAKGRDKNLEYEYLATVKDINTLEYVDDNINVDEVSYCYRVLVTDRCGHLSKGSNRGCNIVITGNSEPFKFNLNWQDYSEWKNGVQNFDLYRSVDTGVLRPIVMLPGDDMDYTDEDLDYCWGGYFYQVRAYEDNSVPDSSNNAISVSNTIYLIQPPHLYVPSAFTPNDDNINDVWGIVPVFVKEYNIKVFNRWGEKVYDSNDKKRQWAGEYNGDAPFQNVFIWVVEYTGWDNSRHFDRGDVTILK
jgi:gliding motility-associated-like protein